jgi:uncharacterized protein YceH (UPF0502 family)
VDESNSETTTTSWRPLPAIPRRILGVLVEKAKTTPDNYPLSLNALTTGCNQKSNRDPAMNLSTEEVEDALEELRILGAVAEVHGDGRVVRYRHYMKDWLGVDGIGLAVMTELLLRGTQTVGELRTRAARMAAGQLTDLATLEPILMDLIAKKLVIEVTPPGRGQLVTHGLYPENELNRILRDGHATTASSVSAASHSSAEPSRPAAVANSAPARSPSGSGHELAALQQEVSQLREELDRVKKDLADLWSNLS